MKYPGGNNYSLSSIFYILAGFFFSFICFFVMPVYFNHGDRMFFATYVPAADVVGNDFRMILEFSYAFFKNGISPYTGANYYPPFVSLFFSPFLLFEMYSGYIVFSFVTIGSLCITYGFFGRKLLRESGNGIILLLFAVTAVVSYGFLFELERGQFNVFAAMLATASVYIFHFYPKKRVWSYVLFVLSVQLKLYPAIFLLMLVDDWSFWKITLKRFAALLLSNIILFFILGTGIFSDFIRYVFLYSSDSVSWTGNHSISSFVILVSEKAPSLPGFQGLELLRNFETHLKMIMLLIYFILVFFCIREMIKNKRRGFSPVLFFVCTVGALIIPPVSHDYKLAILGMPAALFLSEIVHTQKTKLTELILFLFSLLYSSTLFSYAYKPLYLGNNFPALFLMVIMSCAAAVNTRKNSSAAHVD